MSSPRLLSNRYEIGDTLGYGGMSEVHRGRDIRLGRDVAVKVLRADLARDPTFQLRFRREAQNAAALNHPAIVAVYDTGETDSENGPLPYIVMEYVDGQTLREIVKSEGPLSGRRAMEVMADASAALDFSHRHGIVHRDVKPANIMITRSGAVKVMDFGIARAVADGQAAVTQTAAVIGTAQYLSPEQARGESVDARSDVYASGCVLFELLTGEPPFTGDSPVAVAYQHVREEPRKPSDLNQQVPASLDAVVLKALSKNPANRYQSAAEMRADLVRVLSGQRPKAPMIMSEEERTSMMSAPGGSATELLTSGRHRPDSLAADDAYEEERQRRRRKAWTIGLITAVCVAVFAAVALMANQFFGPPADERVSVPNVAGKTIQQARGELLGKQWRLHVQNCPSTPDEVGRVLWQKPTGGTQVVKKDTTIRLCAGNGPRKVQVPNLEKMTYEEAYKLLDGAGLAIGERTTQEVDDPALYDRIINWTNRGATVDEGTRINVVVGKKAETAKVPDVRGQTYSSAEQTLTSLGFTVKRVDRDSDKPAEEVVDQSPPAETEARINSEVVLYVSNGAQLSMPSLKGMSASEAEAALKAQGWEGDIVEQKQATSDISMDDKVLNSSPPAGQKISKDESITLIIGEYDPNPTGSTQPGDGLLPPFG